MRKITDISEIQAGMVILTGTAYYRVTDSSFPYKFRGEVWDMDSREWGKPRDVPFPSPTYAAYEVSPTLFPH